MGEDDGGIGGEGGGSEGGGRDGGGGEGGGGGGLGGSEGEGGEGGGGEGGWLGGGEGGGGDGGGGSGGGEGGEDGENCGDGGEGGEGGGGASGGASWLMVTSVSVKPESLQASSHVAMPCGGKYESLELMYAPKTQFPSPSRLLTAVVLGASASNIQAARPRPLPPLQSGSQYSQKGAPSAL